MRPWKYSTLMPGALALIWLLLFTPLLLGRQVLPWDAIDQFYPTVFFNVQQLRQGLAPWWNPYIYAGYPQAADPQGMLCSPLLMAWMLLPAEPGMKWFDWGVLLHLLLGGAAISGFLRRLDCNRFGALLGAAVFMAGGAVSARLEHVPMLLAYAYAPLVLLALQGLLANPSAQRGLGFGLAAGALATQLVQLTYLLAWMIAAYALIAGLRQWPRYDKTQKRRWLTGLALGIVVASLMALPQALWSWAFVALSNRPSLPIEAAAAGSLDSRVLWTLLDPNHWHALGGAYDGPASKVEGLLYIGVLPLLLIATGIAGVARLPIQRRQWVFFCAVAVLASVYMFGVNTPIYRWLYDGLPGMALFRRPSDAAFLLNLALAVISGLAASRLPLENTRRIRWVIATASLWLALTGWKLYGAQPHGWLHGLAAAAVAALAWLWLWRPAHAKHAGMVLLLILLVDYRLFNLNGSLSSNRGGLKHLVESPAARFLAKQPREGGPWRVEPEGMSTIWDNGVNLLGLRSTEGYNPLRYSLYNEWYGARPSAHAQRPPHLHHPDSYGTMRNLLGLRYVVRAKGAAPAAMPPDYRQVFDGPDTEIWLNPHAEAAWLTPATMNLLAVGQDLPAAIEHADLQQEAWLTPRDPLDWAEARASMTRCEHGNPPRLHPTALNPSSQRFDIHATQPGWMVLSELDFPGWQASIDRRPIPIHRANGMFRAVCLPAGHYELSFSFSPWRMLAAVYQRRKTHLESHP